MPQLSRDTNLGKFKFENIRKNRKRIRLFGNQIFRSYTFQKFCGWMRELGVRELTGYVFAIENFNRPEDEVTGILEEIRKIIEGVLEFLEHERETTMLQLLVDWSFVPDNLKPRIARITALTKNVNAKLRVNLAFCYSGLLKQMPNLSFFYTDLLVF